MVRYHYPDPTARDLMREFGDKLFAALRKAGMPEVPERFSVAPVHQEIPSAIAAEIDAFIRIFDRVTTRRQWQQTVTGDGPEITRHRRSEVCFFSAWDFHLPPEQPENWQLIECNDNGSGFLFAALINHLFYELSGMDRCRAVSPALSFPTFMEHVASMVESEAEKFFGEAFPPGLFLIVDDADALQTGRFRHELILLRDLLRRKGWQAEITCPEETHWDGRRLLCRGQEVSFIVNRSTDFFWQAEVFASLRAAYAAGKVYAAPNPFTYATRSDKRLLEFLSTADRDQELGIQRGERTLLSAHVPETHLLLDDNVEDMARRKEELVFKPIHGFASRGVLTSAQVGRARLRRLLKKGEGYIAQQRVPKSRLQVAGTVLWADLRVWAYRGERILLSGRGSRRADVLDLNPPGGWLATYAGT
jgi:hypothetical protein